MTIGAAVIVLAKAPRVGHAKTRLCPPCRPEQAAALAEAALADTLEVVAATPVRRRVLVLDGEPGPWLPSDLEVLPQRGWGLDERLAAAFVDTAASNGQARPALLIGMDTPQVTPDLLTAAVSALLSPGTDSVLGLAEDGGWWAMGLRRPDPKALLGLPMSTSFTGRSQRHRLSVLGLSVADLPVLRDVDTFDDALAVAAEIPTSRLAGALAAMGSVQEAVGLVSR